MEQKMMTPVSGFETAGSHPCPVCRGEMTEAERVQENGFVFVWYECRQPGCDGQWLEKKAG